MAGRKNFTKERKMQIVKGINAAIPFLHVNVFDGSDLLINATEPDDIWMLIEWLRVEREKLLKQAIG